MRKTVITLAIAAAALGGCASMNQLTSDVTSYTQWPAARQPGSYVFERLLSQLARPDEQQRLEEAARPAIEAAGFRPAADAASADFSVQLTANVIGNERSRFDDPFYWPGGMFYSHFGRGRWGFGTGLGFGPDVVFYEREVAVLIRDRKSGLPVYESRAANVGASPAINSLLQPMFEAAMKDFPNGGVSPRRVTTAVPPA
jgi:hypothetical protein